MFSRILTVLFLFSLSQTGVHADDSIASVPMKAVRVAPHSYFVQGLPGVASSDNQGFMSNAGFVVTHNGVVVFDALGSPPLAKKLVSLRPFSAPGAEQSTHGPWQIEATTLFIVFSSVLTSDG